MQAYGTAFQSFDNPGGLSPTAPIATASAVSVSPGGVVSPVVGIPDYRSFQSPVPSWVNAAPVAEPAFDPLSFFRSAVSKVSGWFDLGETTNILGPPPVFRAEMPAEALRDAGVFGPRSSAPVGVARPVAATRNVLGPPAVFRAEMPAAALKENGVLPEAFGKRVGVGADYNYDEVVAAFPIVLPRQPVSAVPGDATEAVAPAPVPPVAPAAVPLGAPAVPPGAEVPTLDSDPPVVGNGVEPSPTPESAPAAQPTGPGDVPGGEAAGEAGAVAGVVQPPRRFVVPVTGVQEVKYLNGTSMFFARAPDAYAGGTHKALFTREANGIGVRIISDKDDPLYDSALDVKIGKDGVFALDGVTPAIMKGLQSAAERGIRTRTKIVDGELSTVENVATGRPEFVLPKGAIGAGEAGYYRVTQSPDKMRTFLTVSEKEDTGAVYINEFGSFAAPSKAPEAPKKEWYENPMAMFAISSAFSLIGVVGQYFMGKDALDAQLKMSRENRDLQLQLAGYQYGAGGGGGDSGGGLKVGRVYT